MLHKRPRSQSPVQPDRGVRNGKRLTVAPSGIRAVQAHLGNLPSKFPGNPSFFFPPTSSAKTSEVPSRDHEGKNDPPAQSSVQGDIDSDGWSIRASSRSSDRNRGSLPPPHNNTTSRFQLPHKPEPHSRSAMESSIDVVLERLKRAGLRLATADEGDPWRDGRAGGGAESKFSSSQVRDHNGVQVSYPYYTHSKAVQS